MGLLDILQDRANPNREKQNKAMDDAIAWLMSEATQTASDVGQTAKGLLAPTTGTLTEGLTRALPLTGEAWTANDAGNEAKQGNYEQAALIGAMGLLPMGGLMAASLRNGAKSVPSRMRQSGGLLGGGGQSKGLLNFNVMSNKPKSLIPFSDAGTLPNRGRDYIRQSAEDLKAMLDAHGFKVDLQHSGSIAGPSSYLRVADPETGRMILKPYRISGHSKGVFGSEQVNHVTGPDDFQAILDTALSMRNQGVSDSMKVINQKQLKIDEETYNYWNKVYQRAMSKGDAPLSNSERNSIEWMKKNGLLSGDK